MDELGDILCAKGRRLPNGTNLRAEAVAIKYGLEYCVLHEFLPMEIETDSLTMKNVLAGIWNVPWSIAMGVNVVEELRRNKKVQFCHVLGEGNRLVDYVTNIVFDFAGEITFNNF